MRIKNITLKNFKRFTDLNLTDIPETAKLVLIIGSNGSGKSSVFDALEYISRPSKRGGVASFDKGYYAKVDTIDFIANIDFHGGNSIKASGKEPLLGNDAAKKFYGRSSIRIEPVIQRSGRAGLVEKDTDAPDRYIDPDKRFNQDVFEYTRKINQMLREPVFKGQQADTLKIFETFIAPINNSLHNIFGLSPYSELQLTKFEEEYNGPPKLFFKKGLTENMSYDLLSHGEKQVFTLLLNFIVRREFFEDAIYFIDEMDVHLNTKLQYNLLKEITEYWIPDSCQLWTTSHALGFIEYANDYEQGVVLDFDDLDFDKAQDIKPADKTNYEIFELAVSKEFIDKAFQGRKIIFAEQTDAPIYNDLSIENTFFFDGKDKLGVFQKAKNLNLYGIVDRDYLCDSEITAIKMAYPFLSILPYYSIENLLFHPENLATYFESIQQKFDKKAYISDLIREKNNESHYIVAGITKARDGYPFFKENENAAQAQDFKKNWKDVVDLLRSDEFETFYKVFPAKDYGKAIGTRQNLPKKALAKTEWFKQQIQNALTLR